MITTIWWLGKKLQEALSLQQQHIIIVKKDKSSPQTMTNHPQRGSSVQPYSCMQVAKWTHQQSTDQPTWMKHTVMHRDDCRVLSPMTMKGKKENKFSYDFSFHLLFTVVSHNQSLKCDVNNLLLKEIINHPTVVLSRKTEELQRKPVKGKILTLSPLRNN